MSEYYVVQIVNHHIFHIKAEMILKVRLVEGCHVFVHAYIDKLLVLTLFVLLILQEGCRWDLTNYVNLD